MLPVARVVTAVAAGASLTDPAGCGKAHGSPTIAAMTASPPKPLAGIRVLDFSTLLPGPLATLILAEAGAEVLKIEPPDRGDAMRGYPPIWGAAGHNFALLNRGKRSLALDLKDAAVVAKVSELARGAQVLVEQFRPGVMARLGLGYDALAAINPALVYCSITGYGQGGPMAQVAGHDLNYLAETGLLLLAAGADGTPPVPPGLIADIGGGALPAVINIMLALREAERTGRGRHLDVAMADGMFAWAFWAQGAIAAGLGTPKPGRARLSGGSPRYRVYRTADDKFLAAAPLEDRFWRNFCTAIGLDPLLADDRIDADITGRAVATIIASKSADHWRQVFAGRDVCCAIARTLEEAMAEPHFQQRRLFAARLVEAGSAVPALPVPLAPCYRDPDSVATYPRLGEGNDLIKETGKI
jgi:crotonobetainyl-CoA:carnitine CoA-transferase CaiB-like acyl-CoA transferase